MKDTDSKNTAGKSTPRQAVPGSESATDATIEMSAEKAYYLQRIEVIKEVQDELIAWGRRRFWAISIIVIIIGFFGGASLISTLIETRVNARISKEIERYQSKLEELREAVAVARSVTENASEAADSVESKLSDFENQAAEIETRASNLRTELSEASTKSLAVSQELGGEISRLTRIVDELVKGATDEQILALSDKIKNIEASLGRTEQDIKVASKKAELGKFPIGIIDSPKSFPLIRLLQEKGYSVSIYKSRSFIQGLVPLETINTTIWVSPDTPVEVAVPVIKAAKEILPFLKHVWLRDREQSTYKMVVGYLTPNVKGNIREISQEDFAKLLNPDQSLAEFHELLRSFEQTP